MKTTDAPIKDLLEKIEALPDGRTMLLFDHNPSCTIKTDDLKKLADGKILVAFRSNADDEEYKSLETTDPKLCEDLKDHEYAVAYVEGLLEMVGDFVTERKALVQRLEQAERSLTSCLLTANKILARRNYPTNNPEEWQHVRRFCQEAGVTDSILRQGTSLSK